MIIGAKYKELSDMVRHMLGAPGRYGLGLTEDGNATAMEVLEALLVHDEWRWLSLDDVLWLGGAFAAEEFDGNSFRLRSTVVLSPAQPLSGIASATWSLPSGPEPQQRAEGNTRVTKAYRRFETALLVSAHRHESLQKATAETVRVDRADGWVVAVLEDGVVLLRAEARSFATPIPESARSSAISELDYRILFSEVLFRSDLHHQNEAARRLFELRPKLDVEGELAGFLSDPDSDVRSNVAMGLGVRGYSVPFVPGQLLQPREDRLEGPSVEVATLRALLEQAKREHSNNVIDAIVCTLTIQNYAGKLAPLIPEVRTMMSELLNRATSEQTQKDCRLVLSLTEGEG